MSAFFAAMDPGMRLPVGIGLFCLVFGLPSVFVLGLLDKHYIKWGERARERRQRAYEELMAPLTGSAQIDARDNVVSLDERRSAS